MVKNCVLLANTVSSPKTAAAHGKKLWTQTNELDRENGRRKSDISQRAIRYEADLNRRKIISTRVA